MIFDMFRDQNIMAEDGTIDKAVEIATDAANNKKDTYHGTGKRNADYDNVCLKCVRNIFGEANIPFPSTNSVVTFMDAMAGVPVDLFDNPKDANGKRMRVPYVGRKNWTTLDIASGLKPGDVMVVKNNTGGFHATMITNISGGPDDQGFFQGFYTGVDVVHDRGNIWPVQSSHYEWQTLVEGQGGDFGENRKFVKAYRYTPPVYNAGQELEKRMLNE